MLILIIFGLETVFATHEADHRYAVSGQVRNDAGEPLKNIVLTLEHKGGEKKTVKTDKSGRYEVLFHLHNENLGEEIIISYGDVQKKIKIAFDPDDAFSVRGGVVNFGAELNKEGALWVYIFGGTVIALFFGIYLRSNNKRKSGQPSKKKVAKKKVAKKKKKRN